MNFLRAFFLVVINLSFPFFLSAQKPPIDSSVFFKWPYLADGRLTDNGNYNSYLIERIPEGSQTLMVSSIDGVWKRLIPHALLGRFTGNDRQILVQMPGDSLCLMDLGTNKRVYFSHVVSYQLCGKGKDALLLYYEYYGHYDLVIRKLDNNLEERFTNVRGFLCSENGHKLVIRRGWTKNGKDQDSLIWYDLKTRHSTTIWQGNKASGFIFNKEQRALAFWGEYNEKDDNRRCLFYYEQSMMLAIELVSYKDSTLGISLEKPVFSQDGSMIFFTLIEKTPPVSRPVAVQVDVWGYKDGELQSWQLMNKEPTKYEAVVDIKSSRMIRVENDQELEVPHFSTNNDNYRLVFTPKGNLMEWWWNKDSRPTIYEVSTKDGSRKIFKEHVPLAVYEFFPSPDGRFLLYYNRVQGAYFCLDHKSGLTCNLSKSRIIKWGVEEIGNGGRSTPGLKGPFLAAAGVGVWSKDDKWVLIYSQYDIWKVDPMGMVQPENITHDYGRKHHIEFRLAKDQNGGFVIDMHGRLLLTAFNEHNKYQGFFQVELGEKNEPVQLCMGPWNTAIEWKANDGDCWLVKRMSATEFPNYYLTNDFIRFFPLSDMHPDEKYNWLTAELVHWQMGDGTIGEGILYKPENFDFKKKYPILFTYYEKRSQELYDYIEPGATQAAINIPFFVSNGYLVFVPDIHYRFGKLGESITNCVISAARYLSRFPWVDKLHLGINGHSFGGFETNYLITHCKLFAAAAEASGSSDCISSYGQLEYGYGGGEGNATHQYLLELSSYRMGANPWERTDLYIKYSPVLKADKVTTPLLIMHNKKDALVPFSQAVELFTGLRRIGRPVWLLQYDHGSHILGEEDAKDYTIRLSQFFDHYLKGAPPPKWMTGGISARYKGIMAGYEQDQSGKIP